MRDKPEWIAFDADAWVGGTHLLSADAEYCYFRICLHSFQTGEKMPIRVVDAMCKGKWSDTVRDDLIELGKINVDEETNEIWNDRAVESWDRSKEEIGAKRERTRAATEARKRRYEERNEQRDDDRNDERDDKRNDNEETRRDKTRRDGEETRLDETHNINTDDDDKRPAGADAPDVDDLISRLGSFAVPKKERQFQIRELLKAGMTADAIRVVIDECAMGKNKEIRRENWRDAYAVNLRKLQIEKGVPRQSQEEADFDYLEGGGSVAPRMSKRYLRKLHSTYTFSKENQKRLGL